MLFLFVELVSLPFRAAGCRSYLLSCFVQSYVLCAPFWTVVLIRSAGYDIAYALWLVDTFFWADWLLGLLVDLVDAPFWTAVITCRVGWSTL